MNLVKYALSRKNDKDKMNAFSKEYRVVIDMARKFEKEANSFRDKRCEMEKSFILEDELLKADTWTLYIDGFHINSSSWGGGTKAKFSSVKLECDITEFGPLKWILGIADDQYGRTIKFSMTDNDGDLLFKLDIRRETVKIEIESLRKVNDYIRLINYLGIDVKIDEKLLQIEDEIKEKQVIVKEFINRFGVDIVGEVDEN